MAVLETFTVSGATGVVNYNTNNLRMQDVDYNVPVDREIEIWIYDSGQLIHNDIYTGEGSENIPGQHTVEVDPFGDGSSHRIPASMTFEFSARTVSA